MSVDGVPAAYRAWHVLSMHMCAVRRTAHQSHDLPHRRSSHHSEDTTRSCLCCVSACCAVPPRQQLSKEAYMAESHKATTINHFYEKLLKIKVCVGVVDVCRCSCQHEHACWSDCGC